MLTYGVLKDRYKILRKSHEDIYNALIRADKEIKHLNKQLDQALKDYDELQKRIDKAINILNQIDLDKYVYTKSRQKEIIKNLLNIIRGD